MAKRLTESFKLQMKGYRRKVKKEFWDKAVPTFKNFEIDFDYRNHIDDLQLHITDIVDVKAPIRKTKINTLSQYGATYLINSIICPVCGNIITINRHWNCYFCENDEHGRKIFEITKVGVLVKPTRKDKESPSNEEESIPL